MAEQKDINPVLKQVLELGPPLAFFLNDPLLKTEALATFALLNADFGEQFRGVYMLEPYDPEKIPVLMVHGLWSSPVTWMEMFNDLRSKPEIRNNYQFWFYLYPTGQPFWISAAQFWRPRFDQRIGQTRASPAISSC